MKPKDLVSDRDDARCGIARAAVACPACSAPAMAWCHVDSITITNVHRARIDFFAAAMGERADA